MSNVKHFVEANYVQLGLDILEHGITVPTRTGINCITVDHGYMFIPAGMMPMVIGKKVFPKMALKEMIWFMLGRNDVQWLRDHGVTYWDEWEIKTSERAKELGLDDSWIGTIGKSYGYQWRNFGSTGTNQFHNILNSIINDPFGRRHIISSWCPSEYHQMSLPPCVYDWNVQVLPHNYHYTQNSVQQIHIHAKARSIDYFLGLPYDLLQAYWFQKILIAILNSYSIVNKLPVTYTIGNIHFNIDNLHIYENHIDKVKQYIESVNQIYSNSLPFTESIFTGELMRIEEGEKLSIPEFADRYLNSFDFKSIIINNYGYTWENLPVIKADVAI